MLNYFLRSLLSEGYLKYETVENTANGRRARLIEKEGPTGLLITTTALSLHPENETRMLSLPIMDTREQTKEVLLSIASERPESNDLSQWHAFQLWLEKSDNRVTIPYAIELAKLMPPISVRLRRDFTLILNLIKALAILHQVNRQRDEHGRIIALLEDYSVIRELTYEIIGNGIDAIVSRHTRETVECVGRLISKGHNHVMQKDLVTALKLDKSTVQRRIKKAVSDGYIQNLELEKGRPARLVLGEPLPSDVMILPSVEVLNDFILQEKEMDPRDNEPKIKADLR